MKSRTFETVVWVVWGCFLMSCLSACTINPYTGERQAGKVAIGAGVGAAAGAAIGALTTKGKKRRERALIGAGIGALAGGAVGYYMDVQEAKLREKLRNSGVGVSRDGDRILLHMPDNVTFATDSSRVNPGCFDVLDSVAIVLKEYKKTYVDVTGHTDSTGSHVYNQDLSKRRAMSVAQYMASQGVLADRLLTRGYGETSPIASNATSSGRAQNRRVEIQISPITRQ